LAGQLLGEYDANGSPVYETVYLGQTPVGVIKQAGTSEGNNIAVTLYNVHADHLATARVITRQADQAGRSGRPLLPELVTDAAQ
jgi:hypothetical protein